MKKKRIVFIKRSSLACLLLLSAFTCVSCSAYSNLHVHTIDAAEKHHLTYFNDDLYVYENGSIYCGLPYDGNQAASSDEIPMEFISDDYKTYILYQDKHQDYILYRETLKEDYEPESCTFGEDTGYGLSKDNGTIVRAYLPPLSALINKNSDKLTLKSIIKDGIITVSNWERRAKSGGKYIESERAYRIISDNTYCEVGYSKTGLMDRFTLYDIKDQQLLVSAGVTSGSERLCGVYNGRLIYCTKFGVKARSITGDEKTLYYPKTGESRKALLYTEKNGNMLYGMLATTKASAKDKTELDISDIVGSTVFILDMASMKLQKTMELGRGERVLDIDEYMVYYLRGNHTCMKNWDGYSTKFGDKLQFLRPLGQRNVELYVEAWPDEIILYQRIDDEYLYFSRIEK